MSSATPTPTGAPLVPAAPNSAAPSPPPAPSNVPAPRSRRWVTPVVAVVVAAAVIVAILGTAGFLFHKASTNTVEQFATLSEAESVAGPAASHAGPGSWTVILAAGLRLSAGITLPTTNLSGIGSLASGCNLTNLPGAPTSLTVDPTPVSALPGHAAFWVLGLSNGASTLLLVSVDLGTATPLGSISGGTCASTFGGFAPFPSTQSDSPALVAAANESGGSAFLIAHPNAAQLMAGVGGVTLAGIATSPPLWEVVYTSCPIPLLINETGAEFNATLTGAPASVLTHSTGPMNCGLGLGSSVSGFGLVAGPLFGLSKAI